MFAERRSADSLVRTPGNGNVTQEGEAVEQVVDELSAVPFDSLEAPSQEGRVAAQKC